MFLVILANNETWWSPLLSVIMSGIVGLVTGFIGSRKASMNFYSSTVSKERVEWINQTREITSKLVAFCSVHTESQLSSEDMFSFELLRSSLLMRLTPKSCLKQKAIYLQTDGVLIDLLDTEYEKVRENRYEIRNMITIICKNEWNRIKAEAGGSKKIEKKIRDFDESVKKSDKRMNK